MDVDSLPDVTPWELMKFVVIGVAGGQLVVGILLLYLGLAGGGGIFSPLVARLAIVVGILATVFGLFVFLSVYCRPDWWDIHPD